MLASRFDSPGLAGFSLFSDLICSLGIATVIFGLTLACFFLPSLRGQFITHSAVAMIVAALPCFTVLGWRLNGRLQNLSGHLAIVPAISAVFWIAIAVMRRRYRRSSPPLPTSPGAAVILWALTVVLPWVIYLFSPFR
jgi:hypothetical protein